MIHNATYKTVNGEAFIEGFETAEPSQDPWFKKSYNEWLATKQTWRVRDKMEFECAIVETNWTGNKTQGIPLPKEISDRIEIVKDMVLDKIVYQYAILRPLEVELKTIMTPDLEFELNIFGNWLAVNNKQCRDSNQVCKLVKEYLTRK